MGSNASAPPFKNSKGHQLDNQIAVNYKVSDDDRGGRAVRAAHLDPVSGVGDIKNTTSNSDEESLLF